ncbi:Kelch-type beta propeller, partial [Arabidopsis thaliana x Arabidopsis arenosa]
ILISMLLVMVMDCRSHTWREAPSMRVARDNSPSTCVLNGKIYVIGGCKNLDSTNWIEVFDTKTQTWEFLQIPSEEICRSFKYKSVVYKETVYVSCLDENYVTHMTYKIHKGRWREAHLMFNHGSFDSPNCSLQWYDSYRKIWKNLKGLMRRSFMDPRGKSAKLVNYGGNIALLWEEYMILSNHRKRLIWCEEIVIEKEHRGEIWGLVKWSEVVFITDEMNRLEHALATNV